MSANIWQGLVIHENNKKFEIKHPQINPRLKKSEGYLVRTFDVFISICCSKIGTYLKK
jgi:hypothetical protein